MKGFVVTAVALAGAVPAFQTVGAQAFPAGSLLVTTSTYAGNAGIVLAGVTQLPGATAGQTVLAVANGSYSQVFNNESVDAAFGVTSPITIEVLTPAGQLLGTYPVSGAVTSFSSKSEMGLNLTDTGGAVSFMGYVAPINALDVSNSNTPGVLDTTNPVQTTYSRAIIVVNADGSSSVTPVSGYSGNNGRAAILNNGLFYMVGNAGNSGNGPSNAILDMLSADTGSQLLALGSSGATTVDGKLQSAGLGNAKGDQYGFSVTQLGYAADKTGKDDNFRGETIYNNTLYVTKGSGSNGVNTVYQAGAAGTLPNLSTASTTTISVLPGFSTTLANSTTGTVYHPFGIWFSDPNTLYVADEGNQLTSDEAGLSTYATNAGGLQKWTFNGSTWTLRYTLTQGLNLGQPYTVAGTVTDSTGSVTQYPDGLRHLTGVVNGDGTVTIYATTSSVGGLVDQGGSPNQLVSITDTVAYTTAAQAAGESFTLLQTAAYGQVIRGVSFAPSGSSIINVAAVNASALVVTAGQSSTLTVTPSGTGPFTYQWYAGTAGDTSNPIAGATGASYTTPGLSGTTSYWVQVTLANGTVENSKTITVTVGTGASGNGPATGDGPLPLWALGALGMGLFGLARRRLN